MHTDKKIVDPGLYSKDYFMSDNDGWREYIGGLDHNIHPKFKRILKIAGPAAGNNVLDVGCGRGELIYYCAKLGARVLGIDYSGSAIEIANETIKRLPEGSRFLARAEVGDISTYDFKDRYDLIFMLEIFEHMHDWQLEKSFKKIYQILNNGGRLIIMTPNYYYEKYLSPLKRILDMPLNLVKWPTRVLKGKFRQAGALAGLKKIFRIRADRGELNRMMHVNVSTPAKIRKLLGDYEVSVWCEDYSRNIASILTQKWWGRDIVAVARKRS